VWHDETRRSHTSSIELIVEQRDCRSEDGAREAGATNTCNLALHHEGNAGRLRRNIGVRASVLQTYSASHKAQWQFATHRLEEIAVVTVHSLNV
jgi:hypothetical protein